MTRVLGVARSGFYVWLSRQGKVSARTQAQHVLDAQVADAFAAAKERSGAIRITKALAKRSVVHNRKTVATSLLRQGLRADQQIRFSRRKNGTRELGVDRQCPTNSAISATRLISAWLN